MRAPPAVTLRAPFDAAAPRYDELFDDSPVTRHLRSVVRGTLLDHFTAGARVLELNCGTGTDAIALAEQGIYVTGIDSSAGMIARAEAKIAASGLGHCARFLKLDFNELGSLGGEPYDGAFSNFAGLNCSPDPGAVAGALAGLLKPGSVFVACFLNRVSLWEISSFLARGRFRLAFRRLRRGGADVPVGESVQHVWYASPREVRALLSPWFEIAGMYGLSICSPPPASARFAASYPRLVQRLLRFDGLVRSVAPFRSLGDHLVVVARRRKS
jgi:ubiquinone/menaquinone biosynthesis C-methylase UbiE